jgi:L-ribulose-5-phosphate 4-epimerase
MTQNEHFIDEGYIKFNCDWINESLPIDVPASLIRCRDEMYQLKLIGYYPQYKVGYGNISIKTSSGILISGTQTGNIFPIKQKHFTLVTDYDIAKNKVFCKGTIQASSETMTHAAIYEADADVNSIIHIHHLKLWEKLLNKVPTTKKDVPYGTPEMAYEIFRLFKESKVKSEKIIIMAGHEEGIIFFGDTIESLKEKVKETLSKFL